MNLTADMAQMVTMWVTINVVALVALIVMSFVSGAVILNWLAAIDRRMLEAQKRRIEKLTPDESSTRIESRAQS